MKKPGTPMNGLDASQLTKSANMFNRLALVAIAGAVIISGGYIIQERVADRNRPSAGEESGSLGAAVAAPDAITDAKQTTVNDDKGARLATFTQGSRTVLMRGPSRTFAEPTSTTATITTTDWVRVYPTPYTGTVDPNWLVNAVEQNQKQSTPDVLQLAMGYIIGAKAIKNDKGLQIAGDAGYGPMRPNGDRESGADFSNYLGVDYKYGSRIIKATSRQLGNLDDAGFVRMVWGYRAGLPVQFSPSKVDAIPRQADQILDSSLGLVLARSADRQITDFSKLQAGDLVFHDISNSNGDRVDQVGMFLGVDSQGNHRFIASRKAANGPTFGDIGGSTILDGNGQLARSFKAIRRF